MSEPHPNDAMETMSDEVIAHIRDSVLCAVAFTAMYGPNAQAFSDWTAGALREFGEAAGDFVAGAIKGLNWAVQQVRDV